MLVYAGDSAIAAVSATATGTGFMLIGLTHSRIVVIPTIWMEG